MFIFHGEHRSRPQNLSSYLKLNFIEIAYNAVQGPMV